MSYRCIAHCHVQHRYRPAQGRHTEPQILGIVPAARPQSQHEQSQHRAQVERELAELALAEMPLLPQGPEFVMCTNEYRGQHVGEAVQFEPDHHFVVVVLTPGTGRQAQQQWEIPAGGLTTGRSIAAPHLLTVQPYLDAIHVVIDVEAQQPVSGWSRQGEAKPGKAGICAVERLLIRQNERTPISRGWRQLSLGAFQQLHSSYRGRISHLGIGRRYQQYQQKRTGRFANSQVSFFILICLFRVTAMAKRF